MGFPRRPITQSARLLQGLTFAARDWRAAFTLQEHAMTKRLLTATLSLAFATGAVADDQGKTSAAQKAGVDAAKKYIKELDKNNDGELSRDELPADLRDGFMQLDANKDGKLSAKELEHHAERMSQAATPVEVVSVWLVEADTHAPSVGELQSVYELLRKADTDNDGQLTPSEIKAARRHAIEKRVDSAFKRCDTDTDGKISRDEARGPMAAMFDRADKNKDGFVTKDECMECCTPQATTGSGTNNTDKK